MGKASKTKQQTAYGRREKIAAQRAAARRSDQRRNGLLIAGGAVIVVIAVVVAFIVVKTNKSSSSGSTASPTISGAPTGTNLTSILKTITTVPTSATDAVGSGGSAVNKPTSITSSALTSGGKPEMLYIGAEYCPYCAAERWPMIVALSRFGTFTGIQPMKSSGSDVYPNTSTWTFAHATYTSKYVTFTPVEWYTNVPASGGGYTVLDTPTAAQQDLINKYGGGGFPFVDFAGKYVISGQSYTPQTLAGLSWNQIASDLTNSSSPVAQAIGGTANYMTAALCKLTGNLPATACTSTVQGLEGSL
jgi:thiol-disulfide isomerase/thioredoxin